MTKENECPVCRSFEVNMDLDVAFGDAVDNGFMTLSGWCNHCNATFDLDYIINFNGFANIKPKEQV